MQKLSELDPNDKVTSLSYLRNYVDSFAGLNCGDPRNPIWFTALEPGGGEITGRTEIRPEEYKTNESHYAEFYFCSPREAEDLAVGRWDGCKGTRGGSAFYRAHFGILTALVENDKSPNDMTRARKSTLKYEYFGENRLGYSLNISPLSVSNRSKAHAEWNQKIIREPGRDDLISFSEWTGFANYASREGRDNFFSWCAETRSARFTAFRKKYAPAVIYCGGWSVAYEEFCIFWSGMKSDDLNMQIEQISEIGCHYTWLRNGEEKRPTLLMIGPFFANRYGLNSYRKYFDVAKAIKALVEQKLGSNALELSKFLP